MTDKDLGKAREFQFSVCAEPAGFSVYWHINKSSEFKSGEYHVIEYSYAQQLEQKIAELEGKLEIAVEQFDNLKNISNESILKIGNLK